VNNRAAKTKRGIPMSTTKKMSKIRVLAFCSLTALLGPSAAMAQSQHFTVPFGFSVGSKPMAAGGYRVSELRPNVLQIWSEHDRRSILVGTNAGEHGKDSGMATLTFHRYGERYFLSSMSDYDRGWKLATPAAEKELIAAKRQPEPYKIIASAGR
jgi:hypothetical protein